MVDVSVIVPVYNVEEYLEDCLDSLLRQGDLEIEVIIIDDGSTDSSGCIADKYAEAYPFFKCYHIENNGLGHARNYGVSMASGRYITFLDSDDLIPDYAYYKMLTLADKHEAELTICNVERFNSKKTSPSPQHQKAFLGYEEVSHITRNKHLIYDTISCNKLISREFYLKYKFEFPEHILYEDIPVTIPMHFMCNKVAMMKETGYLWRLREGNSKSITQQASSLKNLHDRLKIMRMLDDYYKNNVDDAAQERAKQYKYLDIDLKIFINKSPFMEKEQAVEMLNLVNEYIDLAIDEDIIQDLPIIDRQKYYYVRNRDLNGLLNFMEYTGYSLEPVREDDGEFFINLPDDKFTVQERIITKEFLRKPPIVSIENVKIDGATIDITGFLYWNRLNMQMGDQNVTVRLTNYLSSIELETETHSAGYLTSRTGHVLAPWSKEESDYCYDGAGFKTRIDVKALNKKGMSGGIYHLEVGYRNRCFEGIEILRGISEKKKDDINQSVIISDNSSYKIEINQAEVLNLCVDDNPVFIKEIKRNGDFLDVTTNNNIDQLYVIPEMNCLDEPFYMKKKDNETFSVKTSLLKRGTTYTIGSCSNRAMQPINASAQQSFIDFGTGNVIVCTDTKGRIHITLVDDFSYVTEMRKEKNSVFLKLMISSSKKTSKIIYNARITVRDKYRGETLNLAEMELQEAEADELLFKVELLKDNIAKLLYRDDRPMYLDLDYGDGFCQRLKIFCPNMNAVAIRKSDLRAEMYCGGNAELRLSTKQPWPSDQASKQKRNALVKKHYHHFREKPINKRMILFESTGGSRYGGDPGAIYKFVNKHYPEYKCVWALNDVRVPIEGKAIVVRRGSLRYYEYLAVSGYLINDAEFPKSFIKRKDQIEIHAVIGAPIEENASVDEVEFEPLLPEDKYNKQISSWDYLVAQGSCVENSLIRSVQDRQNILRTGAPHTDALHGCEVERILSLRTKIGIPEGKKVVLYAPATRSPGKHDMHLNLKMMKDSLSDEYVLITRIHQPEGTTHIIYNDDNFVLNLSNYQNENSLLLVSDILITDYSPIALDYVLLNKPIIFFAYDLEIYRRRLGEICLSYEDNAPGPICKNTEEVISAIKQVEYAAEKYIDRMTDVRKECLTYECDNSAKKVIMQAIRPNAGYHYYNKMKEKLKSLK